MIKATILAALVCVIGVFAPVTHADSAFRDQCIQLSARQYYSRAMPVSYDGFVDLIRALMKVEGGCGVIAVNANGSRDYGCMQINSSHLRTLSAYGIGADALQLNDCQNILVGTWILQSELVRGGDLWQSIGNYNSRTPRHNQAYQLRVWRQLQRLWADRLAGR